MDNNTDISMLTKSFFMGNNIIAKFTIVPIRGVVKVLVVGIPAEILQIYMLNNNTYRYEFKANDQFKYNLLLAAAEDGFEVLTSHTGYGDEMLDDELTLNSDGTLIWKENNVLKTY